MPGLYRCGFLIPPVVAAAFLAACAALIDFGLGCFPLPSFLAVCFVLAISSFQLDVIDLMALFKTGNKQTKFFCKLISDWCNAFQ